MPRDRKNRFAKRSSARKKKKKKKKKKRFAFAKLNHFTRMSTKGAAYGQECRICIAKAASSFFPAFRPFSSSLQTKPVTLANLIKFLPGDTYIFPRAP
jgi:hypothetical protein